jgi:hypothetical protein
MNKPKINHLAILVCVVICFAIGFVWYGSLFGPQWMAMVNIDMATIQSNPPGAGVWITNLASCVVPLYVLAWLFTKLNITSGINGAMVALLIVFAFHHLPGMTSNMFARGPYGLAWITGGYEMVCMTIAGFILGAWRKTAAA